MEQVPNTPLGHASIHALKDAILEGESTDEMLSVNIVRMFFGIQTLVPAQVEIMSNVINAVGGMRDKLVASLRNKFAEGALWEFTTDFGLGVTLSKIQHKDGINPLRLTLTQKTASGQLEKRPLVEFTGGQCKFFDATEREAVATEEPKHEKFSFTTDTVKKETNEPVPETVQPETPASEPEPEPEPATEAIQNEPVGQEEVREVREPENSGLTSVESLEPEPANKFIPIDTTVRVDGLSRIRIMNKVHEAAMKIIASGVATIELIDQLIRSNLPKHDITVEYRNETVYIEMKEKPVVAEPPKPAPVPTKEELEAQKKIAEDLNTLMTAEETLQQEFDALGDNAWQQLKLLQDFQSKIKAIDPSVRKDIFSKEHPDKATSLAKCFNALSKRATEGIKELEKIKVENNISDNDWEAIKDGKVSIREVIKTNEAMAEAAEEQQEVTISVEEVQPTPMETLAEQHAEEVVEQIPDADPATDEEIASLQARDIAGQVAAAEVGAEILHAEGKHEEAEAIEQRTEEVIAATSQTASLITDIAAGAAAAEENLNSEPEQKETKEMIVRIDCAAEIPNEDYEKIKAKVAELHDPNGNELTDVEKSKLVTADLGYECNLTTIKIGEEYVVSIPIEDDPSETKSEEQELQEAMTSDKQPEQQWLDLSDASVREPFIQTLFPGISYPSYMHLMTFLKKFHTEEQTKTFIATKGSIPTETTIVYDNVTFCIVKMKESRFYRIFIANTDYSLKEHGWCETNFMPNRWFRLGQDIHNPCFQNEGIIENRGGFHRGFGR